MDNLVVMERTVLLETLDHLEFPDCLEREEKKVCKGIYNNIENSECDGVDGMRESVIINIKLYLSYSRGTLVDRSTIQCTPT